MTSKYLRIANLVSESEKKISGNFFELIKLLFVFLQED